MTTRDEIREYVRRAAAARGIDPNTAERVARGESGFRPDAKLITPREKSYGVWQLNTQGGLGKTAEQRGISLAPENWRQQTDFALDTIKKDGWRQWSAAKNAGISRWQGIGGAPAGDVQMSAAVRPSGGGVLGGPSPAVAAAPGPNSPLPQGPTPEQLRTMSGILADTPDPFKQLAETRAAQEKEQQAQQLAQALVASTRPEPQPQPTPAAPPEPPVDYAALLMPHLRRGLLGSTGYGGLLA